MNKNTIRCLDCRYYYITYDELYPYGCRKMGFKSKTSPKNTVFSLSEIDCLYFTEKIKKKKDK